MPHDHLPIEKLEKAFNDHHETLKAALEKSDQFNSETQNRLAEIEQRLVRRGRGGGDQVKSWGTQVAESDEFKALAKTRSGRAHIDLKTTITTGSDSGGPLAPSDRVAAPDMLPRRKVRVRDLIAPGRTNSTSVEFARQTTRANNAAPVAEEATKPESALAWEWVSTPTRTIAHWIPASKQIFDDAPQFMSLVDSELIYGLADVEEQQLLTGSGVGENLNGIYTQATSYSAPITPPADLTMIDVLLLAIAQVDAAKFDADGLVLNPLDWYAIQMIKTAMGEYLGAGPFSADAIARLWRMPVATTTAMAQGTFLAGAFRRGAQIFDRQDATVEISTEHSDFFIKNKVAIRAEERLALVVYRPLAFVKGSFAAALAPV